MNKFTKLLIVSEILCALLTLNIVYMYLILMFMHSTLVGINVHNWMKYQYYNKMDLLTLTIWLIS
jgi:hypothetical protein